MMTLLFYLSYVGYAALFTILFNLDFDFSNPLFYLLSIVILIISFILAFINILLFTDILARIRKNKGYDNKFNHYFSKSLLRFINHLARVKIKVTGYENVPKDNKFVLMGNHQDNFDIMVYLTTFKDHPINFIAKESLFKAPIIGLWIKALGNIPISKFADRQAAEAIINGIKRYKSGNPVAIFPEGKRSFGNELIEFKPGAFKLAMKSKADLLIGVLYDVYKIPKTAFYKQKKVYVHFLPVLKHEDYKHMKSQELSTHVKGLIQEQLDKFKEAYN